MANQSVYRPYRRRRRRNSHYGVLVALILVIVIAIPVAFHIIKGISGAIFGGDQNELVYQVDNTQACLNGKSVDLGKAPYRSSAGTVYVALDSLCSNLGIDLTWDESGKSATLEYKKNQAQLQAGSITLRYNKEDRSLSAAPESKDGALFVPVRDVCQAFTWQVGELGAEQGDLIVIAQTKKTLNDKQFSSITDKALTVLGPSAKQLTEGSVLLRTDSDKLVTGGENRTMAEEQGKRGKPAVEVDGVRYVPLKAAVTALGGTASFDGKSEWTVEVAGHSATVHTNGKAKVDGDSVKGGDCKAYQDDERGAFYVSAPLFAAVTGKTYTDLGEGAYAFTPVSLEGFDSQKAFLRTMEGGLTTAVGANIPEADVYVALTFDDGPTGRMDSYPSGYTATLLDELAKRNVHATFFMCGYRIKDFNDHMERYLAEGHELGNHTMNHPDSRLTHMDAASVREEVESNDDLIESYTGHRSTVMRPVGGGVNDTVKEQMKELGLPIINWNVDTLDWQTRNDADSVKNHIVNEVQDGDIVLMHDIWPGTMPGVLAAIDELQSRTDKTYAFVTVSELAAVKGVTLEPGVVYSGLRDETVQAIQDGTYQENIFD